MSSLSASAVALLWITIAKWLLLMDAIWRKISRVLRSTCMHDLYWCIGVSLPIYIYLAGVATTTVIKILLHYFTTSNVDAAMNIWLKLSVLIITLSTRQQRENTLNYMSMYGRSDSCGYHSVWCAVFLHPATDGLSQTYHHRCHRLFPTIKPQDCFFSL